MYLFLNHFAFTEPKDDLTESEILIALVNLAKLFNKLNNMNIEIIIHQSLSQSILLQKPIRTYINNIVNRNERLSILSLLAKIKPICSDIDTPYDDNENILLGNCLEKEEKIDVLQTFLSCAMYFNNPILTINNLCNKAQFLKDTIKIVCDNDKYYNLDNYKLIPYLDVVNKIGEYQKENLIDKYNMIDNWNDYNHFVNKHFNYVKITNHCMHEIKRRYSFDNSYSDIFRKKVKRFNDLITANGGKPKEINFSPLGLGTKESNTRFKKLKKSHLGIKDFSGNDIYLNWHEYIQSDCRVYFEKEDNYVSFVHYEKKID